MSRINTNTQSLIAQRVLDHNNRGLNNALERLSTGLRINRGKDDPAGIIASENLRSEQKSLTQAIANAERADQVMNIAEGGLQEVSSLLTELQSLLTQTASSAGLSLEEKNANQLQVDSILQTIDRISNATNFQGIKLLNGNFDFVTSGVSSASVTDFRVKSAKFNASSLDVNVQVTQSATVAHAYIGGPNLVGVLDLSSASATFIVEVGGTKGSREFTFTSGTTIGAMADAINQYTDVTGIVASAAPLAGSFSELSLKSQGFGKDQFVSVRVLDDGGMTSNARVTTIGNVNTTAQAIDSDQVTNGVRSRGQDIAGTINGVAANGRAKTLSLASDFLDVDVTLSTAEAQGLGNVGGTGGASSPAFTIKGGGADFQLNSRVDIGSKVSLGIQEVGTRKLGNSTLGYLNNLASGKANNTVTGSITRAQEIVTEAIKQVSSQRGRIGAFQKNVVGATIRSLGISVENTAAAQSTIRDADFAAETANLTRSQILVSAATNVLGLANSQPQSALQLLG